MVKNIEQLRESFYLDNDGVCRWKYLGEISLNPNIKIPHAPLVKKNLPLGMCNICGKRPLIYNFILQYIGNEKPYDCAVVGSECIQFLDKTDYMNFKKDERLLLQAKREEKCRRLGTLMKKYISTHRSVLENMEFTYYGHVKNVLQSMEWLSDMLSNGNTLENSEFWITIKKLLPDFPNLKNH